MPEDRGKIAVVLGVVAGWLALAGGAIWLALKVAPPKVYTCPYCTSAFPTEAELLAHIEAAHPEEPPVIEYPCPYCGLTFDTEAELLTHIQTEHPPEPPPEEPGLANVYGFITDADIGIPIAGAEITFYQALDGETETYKAYTNEWGYYEITNMIADVKAEFVVYAGGYETKTGSMSPKEGNNEFNLVMTWIAGPRDVPQLIAVHYPGQIASGALFPVDITFWLPYVNETTFYDGYIRFTKWRDRFSVPFAFVPSAAYAQMREKYKETGEWMPFDSTGQWTFAGNGEAMVRVKWEGLVPAPIGIYTVEVRLSRTQIFVGPTGLIETGYTDWEWGPVAVGEAEVL